MTFRRLNLTLLFFCSGFIPGHGLAQADDAPAYFEAGLPVIQNFSPKDYNAYSQNWAIVQGHDGVMYFGNGSGVLVYDGVSWRLIPVSNNTVVRSLAVDVTGRIYVGARGDVGYLAPDENGSLRYISLLNFVTPEARDFGDVWETHITSRGVFFRTINYLFHLERKQIPDDISGKTATNASDTLRYWYAKAPDFSFSNIVADTIFVAMARGNPLSKLVGDSLQPVTLGAGLKDVEFYAFLPLPQTGDARTKYLALSRKGVACIYDGSRFTPLKVNPDLRSYIQSNYFFRASALGNNLFALATASGGAVIIDEQTEIVHILTKAEGLPDNGVYSVSPDREGGLWLALNTGLARLTVPSPLTTYPENLGITSNVESVLRHKGVLYAATGNGLYYLSPSESPGKFSRFKPVPNLNRQAWSLLSIDEGLVVATTFGVHLLKPDQTTEKLATAYTFTLCQSQYNSDIIFIGSETGLQLLQKIGNRWQFLGRFPHIVQQIRSIMEAAPGVLWLGTRNSGYVRVTLPPEFVEQKPGKTIIADSINLEIAHFGKAEGVPDGYAPAYQIDGMVTFGTTKGLRRFDGEAGRFVPDSSLGAIFADTSRWVTPIQQDHGGDIWITSGVGTQGEITRVIRQADGHHDLQRTPFLQIPEIGSSVNTIYADPSEKGVVWIGTSENLLRYDSNIQKDYKVDFPCLLRKVIAGDSVVFGGASEFRRASPSEFDYASHNLRFEYAATSFEAPGKTRYQTYLEGFDDNWSRWTTETQKDYTNIPEGNYTFRVRAKNIYEHLSSEGRYEFIILPPWYRTLWAYAAYSIFAISGVFLLVRWRVQRLRAHANRLEGIIAERTAELADKNEKLQELDTLKSRFFANISHEFRTPLTLILGPIENLQNRLTARQDKSDLHLLHNNARRLQQLIGQLLDLSKLEAGQMTLNVSRQNIVPLLQMLTGTFKTLAQQNEIDLKFESAQENIPIYFDQDKIEKVMYNLMSNALKFTPNGGHILVRVEVEGEGDWEIDSDGDGEAKITVCDSGIGIPKDRLPHIFDRFFQVDSSSTREHEGTGIGLALTRELVQLHSGSISVESVEGQGATFEIRLPCGTSHLTNEQMQPVTEVTDPPGSPVIDDVLNLEQDNPDSVNSAVGASNDKKEKEEIILIAEDNRDMRTYVRDNLPEHYQFVEAADGEEALSLALEHIPDLIITDVMMPKMDGFDLTRKLRENQITSHIPIIMLTAKAAETDRFEGLETGVDAYLTKPFSTEELRIRVRKLIELRQMLQARVREQPVIRASEVMVTSLEQKFLQRLQEIVEENLEDEFFQIDELCHRVGMSRRQLYRKLSALLNCTPAFYLKQIRLERARQLLEKNAGNVTEVAFQVGFSNVSSFSRAFREAFNISPSEALPK